MRTTLKNLFTIDIFLLIGIFTITYFSLSFFPLVDYFHLLISKYNDIELNTYILIILSISIALIIMTIIRLNTILRRLETYQDLALIDPLTNLYNRRYIKLNIKRLISKYKRNNDYFSIILIDLDFFKNINDTYGHIEGDKVLKGISEFIILNVRTNDIVGRWGGEEFIILCPNSYISEAKNISEKLRKGIEKLYFQNDIKVTASFGVSEYDPLINNDQNSLINKVDKALYISKINGRNRVSIV